MRKRSIRAAAFALAALLTLSPAASASQALGTEIHLGQTHLAEGVEYTRQYLWSATYSDLRTERYIEYTPNELVQPVVAWGGSVLEKSTLTALAQGLEAEGKRVLGGVNGDYFVVATGAPLGMVVTEGVLRSSSSSHYALGFDADGNAFIGAPELTITATFHGATYEISGGLNKVRTAGGGYVLYTSDYGATTNHSESGIDVILTPSTRNLGQTVTVDLDVEDIPASQGATAGQTDPVTGLTDPVTGSADLEPDDVIQGGGAADEVKDTLVYTAQPVIGGRMSCTVEQVLASEKSIDIPEGSLVLSVNSKGSEWLIQALSALQSGDTVDIDITCADGRWESAVTAVGGLYKMVTGGVVESGLETTQAPRTAVGVRADGTVVFYTVDGRQSGYSVGASMEQVAKRLVELGCVEAVCMDGGGSTTLGISQPGEESFGVVNQPSDGTQRAVTNALFLVADPSPVGRAERLTLTPGDAMLLSGAQLELTADAVDDLGQYVRSYSPSQLSCEFAGGTVSGGLLTAGNRTGTYPLTARAGGLTGSAYITVIETPDRIVLRNETTGGALTSIHVEPGGTLELSAEAIYRNLSLICRDTDFVWSVSDGVGTIDENGTFTAASGACTGTITVSAGEKAAVFPVTVSGHVRTVESFEGEFLHMSDSDTARIEAEERPAYVRCGSRSARLTYSMSGDYAAAGVWMTLEDGEKYLSLWVYGDGTGNTLILPVTLSDGSTVEVTVGALNFTGWQQAVIPLPDGAKQILTLKIARTGNAGQGTIWLDQVTASNQALPDRTAPTVSVTLTGSTVTAVIQDDVDEQFTDAQITVTCDGAELDFVRSGSAVTAVLPVQDGLAHRITVTAVDASGNIGRASADVAAAVETPSPFADMSGHWADSYVSYLYRQGITTGVASGDTLLFQPDKNITRGEFALMTARWMRLDLSQYSGVQLPFVDAADIPAWCLDAVKAMYALGIMQGSGSGSAVYACADSNISRAEAMTMLGRTQEKGYPAAELTFADAGEIPAWAAEYMASMVTQGVINGYSNRISPNGFLKRGEMAKILYAMR